MKLLLRALWLSLIVALSVSLVPALAFAQPPTKVRDELPEKLKPSWDSAAELFGDSNYAAAQVEYEAIYKETKNPRVLYNIGVCWKERKYYAQAVGTWEKQLSSKDKLPKSEVERTEAALETVRPFVTTLQIESNQIGAKVFIKDIEQPKTPHLAPLTVDAGPNKIVLEKEGFARVERTVEIAKGKPAKVVLNMVPAKETAPAKIRVSGAPEATIFIDGTEMGPAPFEGLVPTGRHTFEAQQKGFLPGRQTSDVVLNTPLNVELSLTPELREGKIRIRTGHADAIIKIDGTVKGTGSWEGLLSAGGHTVVVTKDGYQTKTEEIALDPEQERVVNLDLDRDQTSAWIYWSVTGVLVAVGAATTCYFVLRPAEGTQVTGTLSPGVVPTLFRF